MSASEFKRRESDQKQPWGRTVLKAFSVGDGITLAFAAAMFAASWGALQANQERQDRDMSELRRQQFERDRMQDELMREMKGDLYSWMARLEVKLDRAIEKNGHSR